MTESLRALPALRALAFAGALAAVPALAGDVNLSGSAYVGYTWHTDLKAHHSALSGIVPQVALKVDADVHDKVSFSGKMCFSCHGFEIDRAYIEFTPHAKLNLQAGRVTVPFGDFSQRYDPAGHATGTRPLIYEMGSMAHYGAKAFNLGVVPVPYVDTGVVAYGQVWPTDHVQVWYGGYVVGGMRGTNDLDFVAMRTPYYTDNNATPGIGGRVVLSVSPESGLLKDLSVGVSATHGRYDPDDRLKYSAFGFDVSARLGSVTVRAEGAGGRIDIDPEARGYAYQVIDPFLEKGGFYLEAEHPLAWGASLAYRVDGLRRMGVPLPGSDPDLMPDSSILRYTQGLNWSFGEAMFAKASWEYWRMSSPYPSFHTIHGGIGGVF